MTTLLRPVPLATHTGVPPGRGRLRVVAAGLAGAIALVYGLIATHAVTVIVGPAETVARDQFGFAAPAALVFAVGAVLLLRYDDRRLWVLGALLQVPIVVMYLGLAAEREPSFEVWGVTIRVLQVALFVVLARLALQRRHV
ncbi:MAG TPA: hypothetical protein VK906_09155 [Egicoccus sp.]|nr:hypothetical protein [Egicoccus sp.]HSK23330.1 hypothetical protein [Egicoccus sp.]